jgi:hypothetical protein
VRLASECPSLLERSCASQHTQVRVRQDCTQLHIDVPAHRWKSADRGNHQQHSLHAYSDQAWRTRAHDALVGSNAA